jgi:hypothetical protein|tara:strand:- start:1256 stop:1690 length:435 start_codon:yes stop_codon:yes gene_type:complete
MSKRYARIDPTNTVTDVVLVGDDQANVQKWAQIEFKTNDLFIEINPSSTHVDSVGPSFTYENSVFVERKPYASWTADTNEGVTIWISPVGIPTKIVNDQPPWPEADNVHTQSALNIFQWDEANIRWLNGLGQYWDETNSTWVDI